MFARPLYTSCIQQQRQAVTRFAAIVPSSPAPAAARSVPSLSTRSSGIATLARASFHSNGSGSRSTMGAARQSPSLLMILGGCSAAIFAATSLYRQSSDPLVCQGVSSVNSAARPYAEPHHPAYQGPGSSGLASRANEPPPVESIVDMKSLSFGAVAGISAGIFIKKGLRAAGFLLGGAFIFLQYLGSRGLVNVDWKSMASRYERTIDSYAGTGSGSRLQRVGGRLVDFLLADFPQRSAFLAGIVLGLRIG